MYDSTARQNKLVWLQAGCHDEKLYKDRTAEVTICSIAPDSYRIRLIRTARTTHIWKSQSPAREMMEKGVFAHGRSITRQKPYDTLFFSIVWQAGVRPEAKK